MMFLLVKDDYVYCFEMILCFKFLIGALCSYQRLILFLLVICRLRLFVLGIDEALSIGFGMVLNEMVFD